MHTVVNYQGVCAAASRLQQPASQLNTMSASVRAVMRQIQGKNYGCVQTLRQAASGLTQCSQSFRRLEQAAENSMDAYQKTENKLAGIYEADNKKKQANRDEIGWDALLGSFPLGGIIGPAIKVGTGKDRGTKIKAGWELLKGTDEAYRKYLDYRKIAPAVGHKTAAEWYRKWLVGLKPRKLSQAKDFGKRYMHNLYKNKNSYLKKDMIEDIDDAMGQNGSGKCVAAWVGIAMTGIGIYQSNVEEQKEARRQGKEMSDDRVAAETITETVIDVTVKKAAEYGIKALVGTAVGAATTAAAPAVLISVGATLAVEGINAGIKHATGKTGTEWISDAVLDTGEYIGKKAISVSKKVGKCAKKAAKSLGKWCKKIF